MNGRQCDQQDALQHPEGWEVAEQLMGRVPVPQRAGGAFLMDASLGRSMQLWTGLNYSYILDSWPRERIF